MATLADIATDQEIEFQRIAKVQLTNADVDSISTTPITAIPAPGAGRAIAIQHVDYLLEFVTDDWVGGPIKVGAAGMAASSEFDIIIEGYTESEHRQAARNGAGLEQPNYNSAVTLSAGANPTAGGTSRLTVWIHYTINEQQP